jgi:hypothetical protein
LAGIGVDYFGDLLRRRTHQRAMVRAKFTQIGLSGLTVPSSLMTVPPFQTTAARSLKAPVSGPTLLRKSVTVPM